MMNNTCVDVYALDEDMRIREKFRVNFPFGESHPHIMYSFAI